MTIEELFGTLQMSVVAGWRKHLRTAKYGKHKALEEFYEEMPEKVDALIEGWMGANGKKIGAFQNVLSSSNLNTLKYLGELKRVCKEGKALMNENEELLSLVDDILNLINSTLYKVKELSESNMMSFKDFVLERLESVDEARNTKFSAGEIVDIVCSMAAYINWGKELVHSDVYGVLDHYNLIGRIAYEFDTDESTMRNYIMRNENALRDLLEDV